MTAFGTFLGNWFPIRSIRDIVALILMFLSWAVLFRAVTDKNGTLRERHADGNDTWRMMLAFVSHVFATDSEREYEEKFLTEEISPTDETNDETN